MNHSSWRTPLVLVLAMSWQLGLAQGTKCPVGVNVNSFQNFSAADQQVIVDQLKRSGVSFVRTSLRPDDKNMNLAKNLQSEGIRLVLVTGAEFYPNAPLRKVLVEYTVTLSRPARTMVARHGTRTGSWNSSDDLTVSRTTSWLPRGGIAFCRRASRGSRIRWGPRAVWRQGVDSASALTEARPASNCPPTILSILTKVVMRLCK